MPQGAFISDLHLFARRSRGGLYLPEICRAAANSEHFVLGGDIFDFKWSTLPSTEKTLDAAVHWIEALIAAAPETRIHFIVGNHDDHPGLLARLPEIAGRHERFQWERYYLRIGNSIFLHGDVADRKMTAAALEQRRLQFRHQPHSRWRHHAYQLAVKAQIHRALPHAVYPKRVVARRILTYLDDIGQGPESGVQQVYFGHTHRALDGYRHAGVEFHNAGAPIGHAPFRILRF